MIFTVEIDDSNGQAKVFDENGRMICQCAPYSGSFTSGQVDEVRREVHMQHENGDTGIYELDSGAFKGWK